MTALVAALQTVKGLVVASFLALGAIFGGATATLAWLDSKYASTTQVEVVESSVQAIQKQLLIQKREGLKDKQFQIENALETEKRQPNGLEKRRLREIIDELKDTEGEISKITGGRS